MLHDFELDTVPKVMKILNEILEIRREYFESIWKISPKVSEYMCEQSLRTLVGVLRAAYWDAYEKRLCDEEAWSELENYYKMLVAFELQPRQHHENCAKIYNRLESTMNMGDAMVIYMQLVDVLKGINEDNLLQKVDEMLVFDFDRPLF